MEEMNTSVDLFKKRRSVVYCESPVLAACDFITHAFCTRVGGVSKGQYAGLNFSTREGDTEENIHRNFEITAEAFDMPARQFQVVSQVHCDDILVIDQSCFVFNACQPLEYDAIITNRQGLAICIKTADCVPVFLADRLRRIIGVVHAGWRGTSLNIVGKAIGIFKNHFGSQSEDIVAAIGPSIGPCCYQVDRQVFDSIKDNESRKACFKSCADEEHWMLDLPLLNVFQLHKAGVPQNNIDRIGFCTACNPQYFFSHRGEGGKTGRLLNFLMLKSMPSS